MIGLIWAAIRPWLKSPNAWLVLVMVGMGVAIYIGHSKIKRLQAEKARSDAVATSATSQVVATKQAADDYREAEASTPLDADREYFKALCGKSASCALRSKYAGGKP
jgi:predicted negative regulator of RcsB-dependent stress response